ncbi:hypothetical protein SAMN04487859_1263 [Roseovarius lutimaris]|uniref:Uncharacterized protein n=1 Tax=Roseovarius lutimaris TaxID=1005928 RepID=A0A1I5G7C7_9RHOB|nr:hypothetical protein [Roseovarius lutimaris]SFO31975.1 hypothetical protein SAMN04487859_1263 [Roseovarius lutimaris]
MTTQSPGGANPQSYLPHVGSEFEGHAPADAASTEEAVENAMATIREILSEDRRATSRRSLPDLAPEGLASHLVARPKRGPKKAKKATAEPGKPARLGDRVARLKALRPKPRHAFWLAAFAVVWVWPMFVLAILFVGFWLVVLGAAVFGLERMKDLRDKALDAAPKSWRILRDWPPLTLRREPEPDPFEHRPDPFDRINPEPQ